RCVSYEKLGPRFKRNLREGTRRLSRNVEGPREGHECMTYLYNGLLGFGRSRRAGIHASGPWWFFGEDHDRKRRRIGFPRGRTRSPGDRPRPRRGGVRAGAVPGADLSAQGTEDRHPAVPKREGRVHGGQEP